MLTKVGILIPAFNPDSKLLDLLVELNKKSRFYRLKVQPQFLVIDDGSSKEESKQVLDKIEEARSAHVIIHKKNFGKGVAIKTGIAFFKDKGIDSIVTVDSDGQHDPEDILNVLSVSLENNEFVLGIRLFNNENIPLKSKIGNSLSSFLFYCFTNKRIKDTQTGLRVIPKKFFEKLLETKGSRYEYEFNVLIQLARLRIPVLTCPIKTIYFENNRKTSFRPIFDSILVYSIFFRYTVVALSVSIIDLGLIYAITEKYPSSYSFLLIRGITAHLYFYIMKRYVFNSQGKLFSQLSMYYIVILINIFLSWMTFDILFFRAQLNFFIGYFFAVLSMFIFNFLVQRFIIFR